MSDERDIARKLDELPRTEVEALAAEAMNSPWRQKYHVQPVFGDFTCRRRRRRVSR